MKRNLSAIIALVLAVVMVFPTAIFVGAAGTGTTGAIIVKCGDQTLTSGAALQVAVDGSVTVEVTVPEDYTATVAKTTDGGASVCSGYTFTGNRAGRTDTYRITATYKKTVTSGTKPQDLTFDLNVECIPVAISDKEPLKFVLANSVFDPEDTISVGDITVAGGKLNNGTDVTAVVTGVKTNPADEYANSVVLKGGDNTVYFRFDIQNPDLPLKNQEASLSITVRAQEIKNISIALEEAKPFPTNENITASALKNKIIAVANYKNGESTQISMYDIAIKRGTDYVSAITYNDYKLYKGDYDVEISYAGYKQVFALASLGELYNEIVPYEFELIVTGLKVKDYIEGQVITDFTGAVLNVYREDGTLIPEYSCENSKIAAMDLTLTPFRYGDKTIDATLTVGGKTMDAVVNVSGFKITKRQVVEIAEAKSSTLKKNYAAGDDLELDGLKLTLTYNSGETEDIPYNNPQIICNPRNGDELTTSDKSILIVYADPNTGYEVSTSVAITVKSSSAVKDIVLVSDGAKSEYFIGEPLDMDGYRLLVIYKDNTPSEYINLSSCKNVTITDTAVYKSNAFQKAFSGSLTMTFDLPDGTKGTATLNNIKVIKRPLLVSITATSEKEEYMEGEAPMVSDITITAKYDDGNQRVFRADSSIASANRPTYTVTENGVTYTVKLTPTSLDAGTNSIRVAYTEKVTVGTKTTTTKYDDIEIEVEIPDAILVYYSATERTYITEAFEDLYDALERAEEIYTSTTSSSRVPQIELRRDVTLLSDFPATKPMEIDLNGHTLTMIRGSIYVSSKASSTVEVVFTNADREDAKLIYSTDEDDHVIIAYNDEYIIDRDSEEGGKYTIKITTPKNGKVTGPTEVTHGHDAQFTLTPNEGYMISVVKVNNKNVTVPDNGKLTIEGVQSDLTITVTFAEKAWDNPFTDVYKSATYYKSVEFVYENGLLTGMSATKFEPDTTMTRAMFVTVLGRLAGIDADRAADLYGYNSEFKDVASNDQSIRYAIPYIAWASENGLIEGYGNGKFGPKDNITHAQMYVLMDRYAAYIEGLNTNAAGTNIAANDKKDIPDWAYDAVEYAAKKSFLITSSNRLTPNANAKRAELAMLLDKFCTNVLDY